MMKLIYAAAAIFLFLLFIRTDLQITGEELLNALKFHVFEAFTPGQPLDPAMVTTADRRATDVYMLVSPELVLVWKAVLEVLPPELILVWKVWKVVSFIRFVWKGAAFVWTAIQCRRRTDRKE